MNTQTPELPGLTVIEDNCTWNITHTENSITVTQETSEKIVTICVPIGQKGLRKVSKAITAFVKFTKAAGLFLGPQAVYKHPSGWEIQVGSSSLRVSDDYGDYIKVPMVRGSLLALGELLLENPESVMSK